MSIKQGKDFIMKSTQNKKPYKWSYLEKYPEKYYANLDYDRSPNDYYLGECFKWLNDLPKILRNSWKQEIKPPYIYYYYVKGDQEGLLNYDYISNISGAPVVNKKIRMLLEGFCPDDVQFIEAEIKTKDGIIKDEYYALNILNKVDAIDMEESDYYYEEDGRIDFEKIYFKSNCMKNHCIARESQCMSLILVSEELKQLFRKNKIKGPVFDTDEKVYSLSDPAHNKIKDYYAGNFPFALRAFKNLLESANSFFMLKRKFGRYPTEMIEKFISNVENLNEEGQKNLLTTKTLLEERKKKEPNSGG